MPPSRRRPPPNQATTPPIRRRRVAGHNRPPAEPTPPPETPATRETPAAPETRESVSGTLDVQDTPRVRPSRPASPTHPAGESDTPEPETPADLDLGTDPEPEPAPDDAEPTQRPAGKRRAAGTARPADLTAAEAGVREVRVPAPRRRANQYAVAGVLALVAVLVAGLAFWFRGEALALDSGDDNTALTDSATTSEVIGQLTSAVEDTFSYNYTDLASTQQAVETVLTGKARCEYDQLFGQVKKLAPEQKIVMTTAVRDIALVRLNGDRAEALVFIDQSSTRGDVNNSVAGEAQFGVLAHREGETWKITEFNMFGQPLVDGQPAPQC